MEPGRTAVAAYFRVSTREQRLHAQRTDVERWLAGNGLALDQVRVFEDHESGATLERPGLDTLQRAIFNGEVGTVVLWKLDRLSRSLRDGVNLLSDWCGRGVRVVAVTQQIDLSGPVGQLLGAVLLGLAQIEREHIRERQASGIRAAKQRGVYRGRQRGATRAAPARAQQLTERGLSRNEVASALGVSVRTIERYLAASRQHGR